MSFSRNNLIALSAVAALIITTGCGGQAPEPTSTVESITTHGTVEVDWEKDFPAALKRASIEGKPVLVTFYADWCVWCKRLESTTLRDDKVMTMLRDKVVPLSLDVDNEGRDLSNEYRVDGLPTVLVLDADGREIGRIPGYMAPSGFLEQIEGMLQQS